MADIQPDYNGPAGPDFSVQQQAGGYDPKTMGDDIYTGGGYDPNSNAEGPLAALETNPYKPSIYLYPSDLTSSKKAHTINFAIHIADQSTGTIGATNFAGDSSGRVMAIEQKETTTIDSDVPAGTRTNNINQVSSAAGTFNIQAVPASNLSNLEKLQQGLTARNTTRISDTISLYMPETANFQYQQNWQADSLTEALGKLGTFASFLEAAKDSIKKTNITKSMTGVAAQVLPNIIGKPELGNFALWGAGLAINPQLEVLFKGTEMRTFQFDFLFSPKSEAEAQTVRDIIKTFRFHQAPEVLEGSLGRFFIPPSEFEISFSSPHLPEIGRCVMTNLNIDYAPNGWSAFKNSNGMPVTIRMTLQFMEKELITKKQVKGGK